VVLDPVFAIFCRPARLTWQHDSVRACQSVNYTKTLSLRNPQAGTADGFFAKINANARLNRIYSQFNAPPV
jgi:hypothetical protein